jgi:hypothetical protein
MKYSSRNAIRAISVLAAISSVAVALVGCNATGDSGKFIKNPPSMDERLKAAENDNTMSPQMKQQMIAMLKAHGQASPPPQQAAQPGQ